MRKLLAVLVMSMLAISTASAASIGGGFVALDAEDGDDMGTGFGARLILPLSQDSKTVSLMLGGSKVTLDGMSGDIDAFGVSYSYADEVDLTQGQAGLLFSFTPESTASFYLGGGASYNQVDVDATYSSAVGTLLGFLYEGGFEESISVDEEVGWYAMLGVRLNVNSAISFFFEAMYVGVEVEVDSTLTYTEKVGGVALYVEEYVGTYDYDLSGPSGNVGLLIEF